MSGLTPPTVIPAGLSAKPIEVTRVSGSIPAHVKEAMLKDRSAKGTKSYKEAADGKAPPSGIPPKSPDSSPPEDPMPSLLTKLSTTHPHTEILRLLVRRSDLLRDELRQLASQLMNVATNHNQLIQILAQLQAMQLPIRNWMDKVAGATVMTGLSISFPQVPAQEFHPLLPVPAEVTATDGAASGDSVDAGCS